MEELLGLISGILAECCIAHVSTFIIFFQSSRSIHKLLNIILGNIKIILQIDGRLTFFHQLPQKIIIRVNSKFNILFNIFSLTLLNEGRNKPIRSPINRCQQYYPFIDIRFGQEISPRVNCLTRYNTDAICKDTVLELCGFAVFLGDDNGAHEIISRAGLAIANAFFCGAFQGEGVLGLVVLGLDAADEIFYFGLLFC